MDGMLIEFRADSRIPSLRQSLLQIASGMLTSLHDSTYALGYANEIYFLSLSSSIPTWRIESTTFSAIQVQHCLVHARNIFNLHFAHGLANSAGAHSVSTTDSTDVGAGAT